MDFFKYKNKIPPEKGRLLISEPFLPDPNFERTVVLLCEHNEDGSFGFVLNKPSLVQVNEILDEIQRLEKKVFVGGPVQQDTLHFIHNIEDLEGKNVIGEGIYWGGNFEELLVLVETGKLSEYNIRFFLGYSGWGPGQLNEELEQDSWIVCNFVSEELLFETEPEEMWKSALGKMGGRFSVFANYPIDPRMN